MKPPPRAPSGPTFTLTTVRQFLWLACAGGAIFVLTLERPLDAVSRLSLVVGGYVFCKAVDTVLSLAARSAPPRQ